MEPREGMLDVCRIIAGDMVSQAIEDPAEGPGFRLAFGSGSIEVFPDQRVVRAEIEDSAVRMSGVQNAGIESGIFRASGADETHFSDLRFDGATLLFSRVQRVATVAGVSLSEADTAEETAA